MLKTCLTAVALVVLTALPAASQNTPPPVKIPFVGVATNVSLGLRDSVEMYITNPTAEIVETGGVFGGQNLVGRFKAIGRPIERCAERMVCLQFQGTLAGLEPGGFQEGMYTTWSMTMTIDPQGDAVATYSLGALPSFPANQNGILQLKPRVDE